MSTPHHCRYAIVGLKFGSEGGSVGSNGCVVMGPKLFHFPKLSFTLTHIFANDIFIASFIKTIGADFDRRFIIGTFGENDHPSNQCTRTLVNSLQ